MARVLRRPEAGAGGGCTQRPPPTLPEVLLVCFNHTRPRNSNQHVPLPWGKVSLKVLQSVYSSVFLELSGSDGSIALLQFDNFIDKLAGFSHKIFGVRSPHQDKSNANAQARKPGKMYRLRIKNSDPAHFCKLSSPPKMRVGLPHAQRQRAQPLRRGFAACPRGPLCSH